MTSAPFFNNTCIGYNEFVYMYDFNDYINANVPNIVFFWFICYPQDIKEFNGFTSANFEASHKSIINDLARLWLAAFIIYFFY